MRKYEVDAYNGWLVKFCTNSDNPIKAESLAAGKINLSCLNSCPMKIIDRIHDLTDNSKLIAGIVGFTAHNSTNNVLSLQPAHGWSLMLPPNSPLRKES